MTVAIRLYASLRSFIPEGTSSDSFALEVPEGARVADLTRVLGIPASRVHMFVSAKEQVAKEAPLREGQSIEIFPPLAGGL